MAGEHAETDRPEGPRRPGPGSTHVPWRRGAPRIQQMEEPARTAGAIREPSISTRGLAPLVPAGSSICLDPGSPPLSPGDPGAAHGPALPLGARGHEEERGRETGDQKVGSGHTGVHAHVHVCGDTRRQAHTGMCLFFLTEGQSSRRNVVGFVFLWFFFCVCWLKKKKTTFILQGSILLKYYAGRFFNLVFPRGRAEEEREKTFLRTNCYRLDYEIG